MARGTLRLYLGAAPGVGKTFAMLNEGRRRAARGTDVAVALVETHGRARTAEQIGDLEVVPRIRMEYRGTSFEEMDLDAVLARAPQVALVDELAHTNVPGGRHAKRWEDVEALLAAGIDVISTMNIQHLESLNDVVERITGVTQQETIPDGIVRRADQIELVDMTPEALRRRMAHGNIYAPEKVDAALAHYFRVGNLAALRELALLWMADRVDEELAAYRARYGISEPWETKERIVVALTAAPGSEQLLRRAARMAARTHGELIGLHVRVADGTTESRMTERLVRLRTLVDQLGGRYAAVTGADAAAALIAFARAENATQIILGASRRSWVRELTHGSVINRVIAGAGKIDVHVIASHQDDKAPLPPPARRHRLVSFPPRRRLAGWLMGAVAVPALTAGLTPFRDSLGLSGVLLVLLLAVVGVTVIGGAGPAVLATVMSGVLADYFFTVPYHSFNIDRLHEAVSLGAFVAVAAVVSTLVDRLARRGLQVARARAEAEALARLAGDVVPSSAEALPGLVAELRRTFDLDAAAVLRPDGAGGWTVVAAAGEPVPTRPDEAAFSAELAEGTVLLLAGEAVNADDTRLLQAFVAQLRLAQDRAALADRAASAGELEDANRLRTAILSAVSHDLRTPLAAIKAAATSVLSTEVDWSREQVAAFAQTINAQADRLTALVSNLLDMSRIQAGALRPVVVPVELEDVVYEAVDGLGPASAAVVVDVAHRLPPALADAGLLERALANVVSNALAWSPPGIAVRVEAAAPGEDVVIRVVDQGPGIPREGRERLFQPFQRLGDGNGASPNGLGLGLAVAAGFTTAMGGDLTVEDTPGGGATFVFRLERADPS